MCDGGDVGENFTCTHIHMIRNQYSQNTFLIQVSELGLDNVGGIFLVLGLGILVSGLLALLEIYWVAWKRRNRTI